MSRTSILSLWVTFIAASCFAAADKPPLLIAYFIPSDREVIPGHVERIDRVMKETQRFFRDGMEECGYGPMTFDLERNAEGQLTLHEIKAKHPMVAYGRQDAAKVQGEVMAGLRARGINPNGRVVVIFQLLLAWKDGVATEIGPFVGGGNQTSGTAWVYDDALLDPRQLASKEPGGYYHQPCSIGKFNSHYIGGVVHELGHGLGLPHLRATRATQKHSLMGDGNHTYGQELRQEGPGSFLHPASAMLLAGNQAFAGKLQGAALAPVMQWNELQSTPEKGRLILTAAVEGTPPIQGVAAYNDSAAIPGDYDALGIASKVDASGRFTLTIDDLTPGHYELRLQFRHDNGSLSSSVFHYTVDQAGIAATHSINLDQVTLDAAVRAYAARDQVKLKTLLQKLEQKNLLSASMQRKVKHLRFLMNPPPLVDLAKNAEVPKEIVVSALPFQSSRVGWGSPFRDQVMVEASGNCFLSVGGDFYERGLFAHAPARHVLELDGRWSQLTTQIGIQDGHPGSVVFVVRGDDKELYRSPKITDHKTRNLEVPLQGVQRLELIVEDGGDGASADWGVWLSPTLKRYP